jgi:integrase
MRLLERLRLRVKDVDFERHEITVRDGKGARDRVTMPPARLVEPLGSHLARVRVLHERDLAEGYGEVHLPFALARKYPKAGRNWIWQYIFPSGSRSVDPADGVIRRHHLDEKIVQRAVAAAARAAGRHAQQPRSSRLGRILIHTRICPNCIIGTRTERSQAQPVRIRRFQTRSTNQMRATTTTTTDPPVMTSLR